MIGHTRQVGLAALLTGATGGSGAAGGAGFASFLSAFLSGAASTGTAYSAASATPAGTGGSGGTDAELTGSFPMIVPPDSAADPEVTIISPDISPEAALFMLTPDTRSEAGTEFRAELHILPGSERPIQSENAADDSESESLPVELLVTLTPADISGGTEKVIHISGRIETGELIEGETESARPRLVLAPDPEDPAQMEAVRLLTEVGEIALDPSVAAGSVSPVADISGSGEPVGTVAPIFRTALSIQTERSPEGSPSQGAADLAKVEAPSPDVFSEGERLIAHEGSELEGIIPERGAATSGGLSSMPFRNGMTVRMVSASNSEGTVAMRSRDGATAGTVGALNSAEPVVAVSAPDTAAVPARESGSGDTNGAVKVNISGSPSAPEKGVSAGTTDFPEYSSMVSAETSHTGKSNGESGRSTANLLGTLEKLAGDGGTVSLTVEVRPVRTEREVAENPALADMHSSRRIFTDPVPDSLREPTIVPMESGAESITPSMSAGEAAVPAEPAKASHRIAWEATVTPTPEMTGSGVEKPVGSKRNDQVETGASVPVDAAMPEGFPVAEESRKSTADTTVAKAGESEPAPVAGVDSRVSDPNAIPGENRLNIRRADRPARETGDRPAWVTGEGHSENSETERIARGSTRVRESFDPATVREMTEFTEPESAELTELTETGTVEHTEPASGAVSADESPTRKTRSPEEAVLRVAKSAPVRIERTSWGMLFPTDNSRSVPAGESPDRPEPVGVTPETPAAVARASVTDQGTPLSGGDSETVVSAAARSVERPEIIESPAPSGNRKTSEPAPAKVFTTEALVVPDIEPTTRSDAAAVPAESGTEHPLGDIPPVPESRQWDVSGTADPYRRVIRVKPSNSGDDRTSSAKASTPGSTAERVRETFPPSPTGEVRREDSPGEPVPLAGEITHPESGSDTASIQSVARPVRKTAVRDASGTATRESLNTAPDSESSPESSPVRRSASEEILLTKADGASSDPDGGRIPETGLENNGESRPTVPDASETVQRSRRSKLPETEPMAAESPEPVLPDPETIASARPEGLSDISREEPKGTRSRVRIETRRETLSSPASLTGKTAAPGEEADFALGRVNPTGGTFVPGRGDAPSFGRTESSIGEGAGSVVEAEASGGTPISGYTAERSAKSSETARGEHVPGYRGTYHSAELESNILNTIVRQARILTGSGQSSATVVLDPPSLGRLKLELVTEGSKVSGTIIVESKEVQDIVRNNLPELRQSLSQSGLQVEAFDVQVGHNGGSDGWAQRENMESAASLLRTVRERSPGNIAVSGTETAVRGSTARTGNLDIWM